MNSRPLRKGIAQAGLEAEYDLRDFFSGPDPYGPNGISDADRQQRDRVFSEESSRARGALAQEGCMGHSTFRAGSMFVGAEPVDESLVGIMNRRVRADDGEVD